MTPAQDRVELFMRKAGQEVPSIPTCSNEMVRALRWALINEELQELGKALGSELPECKADLVEIADALGDLLVVVLGAACAFGIKMEPIFNEIMDSNMTKFIDGYERPDGKWMKGKSYKPAELKPILWDQLHPK